jgi:hypothetical protein
VQMYLEVKVKLHTFLSLTLDGVGDQLHAPATFPSREEPKYALDMRLGGTQSLSMVAERASS